MFYFNVVFESNFYKMKTIVQQLANGAYQQSSLGGQRLPVKCISSALWSGLPNKNKKKAAIFPYFA